MEQIMYLCWDEGYMCQVWWGGAQDPEDEATVTAVVGLCWG